MEQEQDRVSPEALADGTTLLILKLKYVKSRDKRDLYPFLNCLRDSMVYVPVSVTMSDADQRRVEAGESFQSTDDVRMRPEFLESRDGRRWFPIFSQPEQLPDAYKAQFDVVKMEVLRCIELAHSTSPMAGLVLDAFTTAAVLPFSIADLIPQIPSMLSREEEE